MSEISYEFAQRHQVLNADDEMLLGPDATLDGVLEAQRINSSLQTVRFCDEDVFAHNLQQYYQHNVASVGELGITNRDKSGIEDLLEEVQQVPFDLLQQNDSAIVVRIINGLIAEAIREAASDVHIQYDHNKVFVRMSLDGELQPMVDLSSELGPLLLSRIKIMSRLNIAEKRLPQDGRMSVDLASRQVDIRVSIIPCRGEERAVLRILDRSQKLLTLDDLGMSDDLQVRLQQLIQRPHGILLVTGPTGSGKTTTLYACLQQLNHHKLNIMTIEDPVEYAMPSISQTAVNELTGMTFAKGLRSILRQDPDGILVGEIRDLETAQIAIQASLTGHLVLSTLHTNSAVNAITRLQDMGVPSYLLASSLIAVIGQRLVRKTSAKRVSPSRQDCRPSDGPGNEGRIGLFEWLQMDHVLKELIHDGVSEQTLLNTSPEMQQSMWQDAQQKIERGLVSEDDVKRVCEGL